MHKHIIVSGLALLLAATPALAQSEVDEGLPLPTTSGRMLAPGQLDVRANFNGDLLLAFVNLGVVGEYGVTRLGPGTLAVGGEFELGACITACLVASAATGYSYTNLFYSPHLRVSYHYTPPNQPNLENVDLYGMVMGGLTYATSGVSGRSGGVDFSASGSSIGPSAGVGLGVNYFLQGNLFVGAEARARVAVGRYTYTQQVGNFVGTDTGAAWSLSGINFVLFGGLRF